MNKWLIFVLLCLCVSSVAYASNVNAHGLTMTSGGLTGGYYYGTVINATQNMTIFSVQKAAGSTATTAFIYDSSSVLLASGTYIGQNASVFVSVTSGNQYYVVNYAGGSDWTLFNSAIRSTAAAMGNFTVVGQVSSPAGSTPTFTKVEVPTNYFVRDIISIATGAGAPSQYFDVITTTITNGSATKDVYVNLTFVGTEINSSGFESNLDGWNIRQFDYAPQNYSFVTTWKTQGTRSLNVSTLYTMTNRSVAELNLSLPQLGFTFDLNITARGNYEWLDVIIWYNDTHSSVVGNYYMPGVYGNQTINSVIPFNRVEFRSGFSDDVACTGCTPPHHGIEYLLDNVRFSVPDSVTLQYSNTTSNVLNTDFDAALARNGLANVTVWSSGHVPRTYTDYDLTKDLSAGLFPVGALYVNSYISTGAMLGAAVNVTIEDGIQTKSILTNGSGYVTGFTEGVAYTIYGISAGYTEAINTFVYRQANLSIIDLFFYTTNDTVTFTIQGLNGGTIPDALVQVQTYVNGTFQTVSSGFSDPAGNVRFNVVLGETYKIIVSKSGYTTSSYQWRVTQTSYTITLGQSASILFGFKSEGITSYYSPTTPYVWKNLTTFFFQVNSTKSDLSYVRMRVYDMNRTLLASSTWSDSRTNTLKIEYDFAGYTQPTVTVEYEYRRIGWDSVIIPITYVVQATPDSGSILNVRAWVVDNVSMTYRVLIWFVLVVIMVLILTPFLDSSTGTIAIYLFSGVFAWVLALDMFLLGILIFIVVSQIFSRGTS